MLDRTQYYGDECDPPHTHLVEVLCDECGETPLLVPADATDDYYWCEDCAANAE